MGDRGKKTANATSFDNIGQRRDLKTPWPRVQVKNSGPYFTLILRFEKPQGMGFVMVENRGIEPA